MIYEEKGRLEGRRKNLLFWTDQVMLPERSVDNLLALTAGLWFGALTEGSVPGLLMVAVVPFHRTYGALSGGLVAEGTKVKACHPFISMSSVGAIHATKEIAIQSTQYVLRLFQSFVADGEESVRLLLRIRRIAFAIRCLEVRESEHLPKCLEPSDVRSAPRLLSSSRIAVAHDETFFEVPGGLTIQSKLGYNIFPCDAGVFEPEDPQHRPLDDLGIDKVERKWDLVDTFMYRFAVPQVGKVRRNSSAFNL